MSRLANRLFAASFVAVTALVAVGSAQAVVYRGSWDPAYGSALPDLGWRGEAFFDIPTACLSQADGLYANFGVCSPEKILSGKVEFYSLSDTNKTTLETLNFDASNFDLTFQMRVTDHKLAGVVGGFILPEESFISLTDTMGLSHSIFWLGFQDNKVRLANCQYQSFNFGCSVDKPVSSSDTPFLNLTPVPEADGYVLALAGVGVLGVAMNRRRRTASPFLPRA